MATEEERKALARSKRRPARRVKIEITRLQLLIDGELTFDDLDDEEVFRMQLRDRNGHFKGRPPKWIPRDLAQAWANEQRNRAAAWFGEMIPQAQKTTLEMLKSRHLSPGDGARLRAAEMIFDRALGKVGSESHITIDKGRSFDDVLEGVLVDVAEEEDDD